MYQSLHRPHTEWRFASDSEQLLPHSEAGGMSQCLVELEGTQRCDFCALFSFVAFVVWFGRARGFRCLLSVSRSSNHQMSSCWRAGNYATLPPAREQEQKTF